MAILIAFGTQFLEMDIFTIKVTGILAHLYESTGKAIALPQAFAAAVASALAKVLKFYSL